MPRGRKPTPTRLKELLGNPGKRPLNGAEPRPDATAPKCPDWLDGAAKRKWGALAPELARLGLLTAIDGDALAAYCQAWAEFRQATETLRREGRYVKSGGKVVEKAGEKAGDDGKPTYEVLGAQLVPHPAVAQQRSAWAAVRAFASLFGLDPSSRSRLKVTPPEKADPFDQFLRGAGTPN